MSVKEIFIKKLKVANYPPLNVWEEAKLDDKDFEELLKILEPQREAVFKAMYGENLLQDRGKKAIKEYQYRLIEADRDIKLGYIPSTMYYLLTQIKIGGIKI